MLNTSDKELYESDLIKSAEKIINDPSFDISWLSAKLDGPLNTNSKFVQIVTNIINSVRDIIVTKTKEYNMFLSELHTDLIKERGDIPPSKLYKDLYEQDKDGNYFFKGKYSIRFRDIYNDEFIPLKDKLKEVNDKLVDEGITVKSEKRKNSEYLEAEKNVDNWLKKHTVPDETSFPSLSINLCSLFITFKVSKTPIVSTEFIACSPISCIPFNVCLDANFFKTVFLIYSWVETSKPPKTSYISNIWLTYDVLFGLPSSANILGVSLKYMLSAFNKDFVLINSPPRESIKSWVNPFNMFATADALFTFIATEAVSPLTWLTTLFKSTPLIFPP